MEFRRIQYFCKYVLDFIIALAFFKISRVSYFTTHMYEKKLLGESFSWVELYISYYNFWTEIHFNDVFFVYKQYKQIHISTYLHLHLVYVVKMFKIQACMQNNLNNSKEKKTRRIQCPTFSFCQAFLLVGSASDGFGYVPETRAFGFRKFLLEPCGIPNLKKKIQNYSGYNVSTYSKI